MFLSLLIYREPFYNIERHNRGERMPITTIMDKVQAVANAILHLPEDHKEVVFFKYEYGFSDKDTSSCLDMTIYDIEKKRKESRDAGTGIGVSLWKHNADRGTITRSCPFGHRDRGIPVSRL